MKRKRLGASSCSRKGPAEGATEERSGSHAPPGEDPCSLGPQCPLPEAADTVSHSRPGHARLGTGPAAGLGTSDLPAGSVHQPPQLLTLLHSLLSSPLGLSPRNHPPEPPGLGVRALVLPSPGQGHSPRHTHLLWATQVSTALMAPRRQLPVSLPRGTTPSPLDGPP